MASSFGLRANRLRFPFFSLPGRLPAPCYIIFKFLNIYFAEWKLDYNGEILSSTYVLGDVKVSYFKRLWF